MALLTTCCCFVGCQPNDSLDESYSLPIYAPASAVPFSEIENVYVDELHDQPNTFVFAVNRDARDQGRGASWGTIEQHGWIRIYEKGPRASLFQVSYISISENDKYLAVVTSGEGHPVLDIFELQRWLIFSPRGGDRDSPPLDPVRSLNSYPFSFSPKGWRENEFVLESSGPLNELEQRRRSGATNIVDDEIESEEAHVFVWNIESGRIRIDDSDE